MYTEVKATSCFTVVVLNLHLRLCRRRYSYNVCHAGTMAKGQRVVFIYTIYITHSYICMFFIHVLSIKLVLWSQNMFVRNSVETILKFWS